MKEYCSQNEGDCSTCSLVNYGLDCMNNPIDDPHQIAPDIAPPQAPEETPAPERQEEEPAPQEETTPEVRTTAPPRTETIIKTHKADAEYDRILWVLRAIGHDASRRPLTLACVRSGWFTATDGHRLHRTKLGLHFMDDGLYEIVQQSKSSIIIRTDNDCTYPEYERVIPTGKPEHTAIVDCANGDKTQYVYAAYLHGCYNLTYLLDMYPQGDKDVNVRHHKMASGAYILEMMEYDEPDSPKAERAILRQAIVMPIKM